MMPVPMAEEQAVCWWCGHSIRYRCCVCSVVHVDACPGRGPGRPGWHRARLGGTGELAVGVVTGGLLAVCSKTRALTHWMHHSNNILTKDPALGSLVRSPLQTVNS